MVRETAYATLTEEDRTLGHRVAGEWLANAGEVDSLVLAEHMRRGSELSRAARFYTASAEQALEGHDLTAAIERVGLALSCGPDAPLEGRLRQMEAHAHHWRGEYVAGERAAREAVALLEQGSPAWYAALADLCSCASSQEHAEELTRAAELATSKAPTDDEARAAQIMCLSRAISGYLKAGHRDVAEKLVQHMDDLRSKITRLPDVANAWTHHARAALAYFSGEQIAFKGELASALVAFDATGEARAAANTRVNLGFVEMTLGNYERAEELLRQVLATTERLGLASVRAYALHNLGHIRAEQGDPEAAMALQREAITVAASHGEGILEGSARAYLALAACRAGRLDVAEAEARRASQILAKIPALHPLALASLSRALLDAGDTDGALEAAERAWQASVEHGTPEDTESLMLLVLAKARLAAGHDNEAKETLKLAREALARRAERVGDAELSRSLLERVSDNAELLALAREHGV